MLHLEFSTLIIPHWYNVHVQCILYLRQSTCTKKNCTCSVTIVIIHQTFSPARNWSKHITWLNILQLGISEVFFFNFQILRMLQKNILRIINTIASIRRKNMLDTCPWTLSVAPSSQFHIHSNFSWAFLSMGERCTRLTLCEAPTSETRPDHNTGYFIPYSFR